MDKKLAGQEIAAIPVEVIERRIYLIRGHKVMLDQHLAELYKVESRAFDFKLSNATVIAFRKTSCFSSIRTRRKPCDHNL